MLALGRYAGQKIYVYDVDDPEKEPLVITVDFGTHNGQDIIRCIFEDRDENYVILREEITKREGFDIYNLRRPMDG